MNFIATLYRILPGLLVALFAGYCVFNTVINNAYEYGATFFDSAEFATVIWRSGLQLYMGPTFAGSIYTTHASTINYIPDLFSYLYPGDRMEYCGLVYALLYAATMFAAYTLFLPLCKRRGWLAALGALTLFFGQIMFGGSWEMRSDFAAPLSMMMGFRAWQLRRYRAATVWFILTAMVREDLGLMMVLPVGLLAAVQYYSYRSTDLALACEKRGWGLRICLLLFIWALATITIQKHYFPVYDLLQNQYYDPAHPFAHLSYELIERRLYGLLRYGSGIWLPVLVLAVAALAFSDWQLLIGAIAFMPYVLGMFFSKSEMSAQLGSYKAFLLILPVIWPALIACGKPENLRRHYAIIQIIVLLCGLVFLRPLIILSAAYRWVPMPFTYNAELYRDFGEKQLALEHPELPSTRASQSILALYPYQFPPYWKCWIVDAKPKDFSTIDTLIWFDGDRDQQFIDNVLKSGHFAISEIAGTKIRVAHRESTS